MDCIFCKIVNGTIPSKVIFEDNLVMVFMDNNPAVNGHLLIIPKEHYTDYQELPEKMLSHIFDIAKDLGPKIMQKLNAESLTLLVNYGEDKKVKNFNLQLLPNIHKKENSSLKSTDDIFTILKK